MGQQEIQGGRKIVGNRSGCLAGSWRIKGGAWKVDYMWLEIRRSGQNDRVLGRAGDGN